MAKFIIRHIRNNFLLCLLLIFFSFLFFYRLDYSTITSWDEGWYASIARAMLKSGDIIFLDWNGTPFYDHPPVGFWLMALSYKLFGISEFSTRLPSALAGVFSVVLIYINAIELFRKKPIGIVSVLILGSCVWYVIRVRSGNLDAIFIFFYLLTIYFAIRASRDFRWFYFAMLSFAALTLTKTLVGLSAGVLIFYLTYSQIVKTRKNIMRCLIGVGMYMLFVGSWYGAHVLVYRDFISRHIFEIGMRDKNLGSYTQFYLEQTLFYIHMGVRKWYYIWLCALAFLIVTRRFLEKNILFLFLWNAVVLYPFLTSPKTEIWHLIPVYLPLSLLSAVGMYYGIELAAKLLHKKTRLSNIVIIATYVTIATIIFVMQIKGFYKEVFPSQRYIPDDVDIAKRVGKYDKKIILDDDFTPLAVYYAGKNIQQLAYFGDNKNTLVELFVSKEKDFFVITRNWALDNLKSAGIEYEVLEKNNSFSIIKKP